MSSLIDKPERIGAKNEPTIQVGRIIRASLLRFPSSIMGSSVKFGHGAANDEPRLLVGFIARLEFWLRAASVQYRK